MEARSASVTPTATTAIVAAGAGGAETVVERAATPIELLAEATHIAREELTSNPKEPASHASKPNTPALNTPVPQTLEPQPQVPSTQESELPALTQASTVPSTAPTQEENDTNAKKVGQDVIAAAVGSSLTTPSLAIPKGEESAGSVHDKKRVHTPVNESSSTDYMLVSPAVAASPHANVGNKRTASGAIKAPSMSLPATPYQPSSASPRADRERIGELSAQLRSRLSYAMIKMQNGLQGRTFDQVEHFIQEKRQSRLSQSPSAQTTPLMPSAPIGTSQTTNQSLRRQVSVEGASSGLGISLLPSPVQSSPRAGQKRVPRHSRTTSDPSAMYLAPAAAIASQNDPSYWAKPPPSPRSSHIRGLPGPNNAAPDSFAARFNNSSARHLAPVAPIRHARSSSGPQHHTLPARRGKLPPPSLPKTFSNMSTMSSVTNISTAPTDVLSLNEEPISHAVSEGISNSNRPCTPVRTTTLTMEQDAVESLMFLSSPGNSQHRGSRPASRSAVSTHQPQFQSQLIQQLWNGNSTDHEGDSFMGETGASTIVDEDEIRLVEEDDELDRELDRERRNQEFEEPDTDQELRKEVNGVKPLGALVQRSGGDQSSRVKRVKTMEEMLSSTERAEAASHWQYADKSSAAPVAPSPMLSG